MTRTRGRFDTRIIVAGLSAVALMVSCKRDKGATSGGRAATVAVAGGDTTLAPGDTTTESAGETVADLAPPPEKWISDANVFSLFGVLNGRTIAAADVELEGWHSEPVRAFASMIAREHAELQHSADSLSERVHIAPVPPALAATLAAQMRAQVDTMTQLRPAGMSLDRAFVREQIGSHRFMIEYAQRLAAVAQRPEIQGFLSSATTRLSAHLVRARALQATFAVADSIAARDSSRRAGRRKP
jgi:predicted outer membrane protein